MRHFSFGRKQNSPNEKKKKADTQIEYGVARAPLIICRSIFFGVYSSLFEKIVLFLGCRFHKCVVHSLERTYVLSVCRVPSSHISKRTFTHIVQSFYVLNVLISYARRFQFNREEKLK